MQYNFILKAYSFILSAEYSHLFDIRMRQIIIEKH